jgi:diadenosine tetraphosphatase ApaH/serine/threonine PP2A family protein phosphatase
LNDPVLGRVLFVHATPENDTSIFTERTHVEKLRPMLDGVRADILICGHTHIQFDRRVGDVRVVNAGSVGMPFEEPGAYWTLLSSEVTLRRTEYDRTAAASAIALSAYPGARDFASRFVLDTPDKQRTLALYDGAELPAGSA